MEVRGDEATRDVARLRGRRRVGRLRAHGGGRRTHVDFMIGGPDLTVTGVRSDGSRRVILEGEHWAL
jgi:leucyl aminopeptidase (aminopeptidase T)